jgi:hypothetical protein
MSGLKRETISITNFFFKIIQLQDFASRRYRIDILQPIPSVESLEKSIYYETRCSEQVKLVEI